MVHTKRITVLKKKKKKLLNQLQLVAMKSQNKQTSLESQSSNLNVMTKGKWRTNIEWAQDKKKQKVPKKCRWSQRNWKSDHFMFNFQFCSTKKKNKKKTN